MPIRSKLPWVETPSVPFFDYFFDEIRRYGKAKALINYETGEEFTFEDIIQKSQDTANSLMALGVEKGEVVLLCVENCPEFVWLFIGITMAGAAPSTLSTKFSAEEMRLQIEDSEARFAFVSSHALRAVSTVFAELERPHRIICTGCRKDADGFPILSDLLCYSFPSSSNSELPKIDPEEDLAYLPYSSGINGHKKGIYCTHKALNTKVAIANDPRCYIQPMCGEFTVALMPFHKQLGMDNLFISLFNGAAVVTVAKLCVHQLMAALQQYKVKTVVLNPLMLRLMCREEENSAIDLTALETVVVGTAPTTKELVDLTKRTFPSIKNVLPVYGMTEVGLISRTMPNHSPTYGSCGILAANLELKIVDIFTGEELDANKTGLIFVSGPSAVSPYWHNEEANQQHFVNGWRNTGDIGYYDEDENLFLVDKTKEMIKVHGFQVIPTEIEKILTSHPCVAEAAVVSVVDEAAGERPFAFVVLQRDHSATTEELLNFTNSRIVRYKQLVNVVVAQMLPKSPCGRILRRLLAEAAALSIATA